MPNDIKIRASNKNSITTVKALMVHPMETGFREDSNTGNNIPAHFIQEVTAHLNDIQVYKAYIGSGVSKNPYLSFKIKGGKPGDHLSMKWKDNFGTTGEGTATIK